jgi:cell division protein FtsQ
MSANGADYYLDDHGGIMPNSKYTSNLPVVTGNVSTTFAKYYITPLARVIMNDDFWRNQIEQINVLPDRGIELVPRVGDHIIFLGQLPSGRYASQISRSVTEYVADKLDRTLKFYKYGLNKIGWNKYSYIDVEFDNQIVCRLRGDRPTKPVAESKPEQAAPANDSAATEHSKKPETAKSTGDSGKASDKAKPRKADKPA